ncbi:MAG: ChaN family lipoprotein [Desulfobacterales bacterium]|nr:MAG: ChaN family lipoprotein [Desulfobacterales bacterium]
MKNVIVALLTLYLTSGGSWAQQDVLSQPVFDVARGQKILLSEALPLLKATRVILVGEHHGNQSHHRAQLRVVQALVQAGVRVAIGLEMFRRDSQEALDRWVAGETEEAAFQKIYYDNWNFPWPAYSPFFEYARRRQIPMIGLNISRAITQQVAQEGFESLSPAQKGQLSEVVCRVDQEYMQYIKNAFGSHAHGQLNFNYFCEAQMVWDNVMAVNALAYLKTHPETVVVILTGTGHARKGAIPRQIRQRSDVPYAVILPETPGIIEATTVSLNDADFILLDLK